MNCDEFRRGDNERVELKEDAIGDDNGLDEVDEHERDEELYNLGDDEVELERSR